MSKMKIGIDATFSLHGGSLGHLYNFIKYISHDYDRQKIILYLKPDNLKILDQTIQNKCTIKLIKLSSYGNFFRILWCQLIFPFLVRLDDIDILFCPGNISPILKTTKVKSQWIANIGPFCKDMYQGNNIFTKILLIIYKYIMLLSASTSNAVIHQADYSKQLFEKKYKFKPSNQYLIECGKDEFYNPDLKQIKNSNALSQISKNDLLYVSHIFPYKNVTRLINAFIKFKCNEKTNTKLYIVGKIMNFEYYESLKEIIEENQLKNEIIFTGSCSKEDLKFAYSICKLFVFPSLCESSGYSLIEAMSCGAPILASDKTAIPDTCKDAAIYFNAYDEDQLLSNLTDLLSSSEKLKMMKKNSLARSSEMISYKSAARIFLNIVEANYQKEC